MACINPDGSLTAVARGVLGGLAAATKGIGPDDLALRLGLPLYRIRASLRELGAAGLVSGSGGHWRITALGREALEIDREVPAFTTPQSVDRGEQGA